MTINIIGKEDTPVTLNQIYNVWHTIKMSYRDAIVLLRSGDNYYSFENDADLITGIMESEPLPLWKEIQIHIMPYHDTDIFLRKAVKAGYRAALCEPLPFKVVSVIFLSKRLVKKPLSFAKRKPCKENAEPDGNPWLDG